MTKLNYRHIKTLYDDYDVFLFDLWGVIVEGEVAYPGVVEQINDIIKNRKVFFVSNAPRPDYKVLKNLIGFGLEGITQEMIVTSGDVARSIIEESKVALDTAGDIRIMHLGADRNDDILHNIAHKSVSNISDADILLLSLYRDEHENISEFDDLLREAANSDVMTICSNPDTTIPKHGMLRYCAGYFAEKIEDYGGNVIYTGKPGEEIYKRVFTRVLDVPKNKILMVGDTFETDILGGQNAGIHSALVLTGNSSRHHGHTDDLDEKLRLIQEESKKCSIYPTIVTSIS